LIYVDAGKLNPIPFEDILDKETGKMSVRLVDVRTESYAVAREYMIRLTKKDFQNPELLEKLAKEAKLTVAEFREKFEYLVED